MADIKVHMPKPGDRPIMYQTPRNKSAGDKYEVVIDGIAPDGTRIWKKMAADPRDVSPIMLDTMCYDKFHEKWEQHGG